MSKDQDTFEELYPPFKALYDESVQKGFKPMDVFGIMLGIIAQQYQLYSNKEEFVNFLVQIQNQSWPDETPPNKKSHLRLVH